MKNRKENEGERALCAMLTAALVLSAIIAGGVGIGGAVPDEVARSIKPDSVAPGEEVTVTIAFTTPEVFYYLWLRDHVPLGWDVTDMEVNEGPQPFTTEYLTLETMGKGIFAWVDIDSGTQIEVQYTLHVPADAEPGAYTLAGDIGTGIGEVIATIPDGTVMVGENVPPAVSDPSADPEVIPDDTDDDPRWGESSTLTVTVTDDSGIASVTVDLLIIGWSAAQPMTNTGGNTWSVTTNASAGTAGWTGTAYEPYQLQVTATDGDGLSNTSVSIPLTVMKNGDVDGNGEVKALDVTYLVNHLAGVPGYEEIIPEIADVDGNGEVKALDVTYLVNHLAGVPGYEKLH